jgi:hypothetical protein
LSQHNGGRLVRQTLPHASARPTPERPSLFAGMDSESPVLDGDTQRVRILSTLESTRQSPRMAPSKRYRLKVRLGKNWQLKALMGLMVTGVLTLLVAFALIVMNGHSAGSKRDGGNESTQDATPAKAPDTRLAATMQAARADRNNPLSALIATPAQGTSSAAQALPRRQAAVIENVATSPVAQAVAAAKLEPQHVAVTPAATTPVSSRRVANHISAVISPASAAAAASSVRAIDARAYAVMTNAKVQPKAAKPKNAKDEDVALLEAMFAHTGNRSAPAMSADEEIKTRCNVLSGAAAATCRAKVCVQNPSAAACHPDQ